MKGQALADFLADHLILAKWELSEDLPDEEVFYLDILQAWKIFFDGVARRDRARAGVVFVTPQGEVLPFFFALMQSCSNNVVEYQVLIIGLEITLEL